MNKIQAFPKDQDTILREKDKLYVYDFKELDEKEYRNVQQYFFDDNGQSKVEKRNTKLAKLIRKIKGEDYKSNCSKLAKELEATELSMGGGKHIHNQERRTSQFIFQILKKIIEKKFKDKNIFIDMEEPI